MGRNYYSLKRVIFFVCVLCVVTLLVKCYYADNGDRSLAIDGKKYSRDKYFDVQDEIAADSKAENKDVNNIPNLNGLLNVSVGDDDEKLMGEIKHFLQAENEKLDKGGESYRVLNSHENEIPPDLGSREEDDILFVRAIGSKHFKKHDENDIEDSNYGNVPVDANDMHINQETNVNFTGQNNNVSDADSHIENENTFRSFPKAKETQLTPSPLSPTIKRENKYVTLPALVENSNSLSKTLLNNSSHDSVRQNNKHNKQSWRVTTMEAIEYANSNNLDLAAMDSFGNVEHVPEYELPILKNSKIKSPSEISILNERQTKSNQNYSSKVALTEPDSVKQLGNEAVKKSDVHSGTEEVYGDDEPMTGVVIIGKPNNTRSYAVFSTTSDNRESVNFIFLVPLTTLAWKRAGFDSIVIVVGSAEEWKADPYYNFVLTSAQKMDAVFIFLEPRPEKSIMISQVARLFAGNILRTAFTGMDDVYLITSDADIWPIYGDAYVLPQGADILSLNSECCSPFKHRGKTYRMLPMANVGMKIRTWKSMTTKFGEVPNSIDDILTLFVREFGNVALRTVRKGDNIGWFLDQMMVSLLISNWADKNDRMRIRYVPRQTGIDRIDRNNWDMGSTIEDKIDSHLPLDAFIPGVWVRLNGLIRAMYGNGSRRYLWCIDYYEQFQELYLSKYRHGG